MMQELKPKNPLINLFLFFSFYQFVLHLFYTLSEHDPRLLLPNIIAWINDMAMLAIIIVLALLLQRLLAIKFEVCIYGIFSYLMIFAGTFLAFYPKMLREYLVFPVNIFDSDMSSATTLIADYLGFSAFLPSLIALAAGLVINRISKGFTISNKLLIMILGVILIVFTFTLKRPSPQPYIYSVQKKIASIVKGEKRVVPSLKRTIKTDSTDPLKLLDLPANPIGKYKHILLLVLEGVTADQFEKEFLTIPGGFYEQNSGQSVYYKNYYTGNLDSYTSLIAMLTAIQVPYRAYADAELYDNVNTAPNVTQKLHENGFRTAFISCYEYQPFVPTCDDWDKIYEREDLPGIDKWISLGSNRMESATEDKAAISTIVNEMKSNPQSFILHELVYGHSPAWRATTGKTQSEYYNEYLMELSTAIQNENLQDSTLFIVVSDHGDRAKSADAGNYRIPLLITGNSVSSAGNDQLLDHTDLPEIIYQFISESNHPASRNELLLVGSTEKWVYGKMKEDGENLFIDNATGIVLNKNGQLDAMQVYDQFQDYLDRFNRQFGIKKMMR